MPYLVSLGVLNTCAGAVVVMDRVAAVGKALAHLAG